MFKVIRSHLIKGYIALHPDSAVSKIIHLGEPMGIAMTKHYDVRVNTYSNPHSCQVTLENDYRTKCEYLFKSKTEIDGDSRLGTYYRIISPITKLCAETAVDIGIRA